MARRPTAKTVQTVLVRSGTSLIIVSIGVRGFSHVAGAVIFSAGIALAVLGVVLLIAVVLPQQRREVREVMAPPPNDQEPVENSTGPWRAR